MKTISATSFVEDDASIEDIENDLIEAIREHTAIIKVDGEII